MDSTELPGDFNPSLRQDAVQFGGEGESTVVPTYHVRVTSADLADFADTKEPLIIGDVGLVWEQDHESRPLDTAFTGTVTRSTLERLAEGTIVNYGIRHIDGQNQMVHVSCGGVSDLFEDDRSPRQRLLEEEPHLADYVQ